MGGAGPGDWDSVFLASFVRDSGMVEAYPALGRADHIGLATSIHPPEAITADCMSRNHSSGHWAGLEGVGPGEWGRHP
jgi:hypothetical protein